jgi:prepilin-type N-terminal cleavage/methylation domain-containing protein
VRPSRRAGFTLIEALFALALVGIVVVKITMVLDSAADASSHESSAMTLEDQARRVLDQVAYKVMGADRNALFPDPESPNFSTEVEFQASFGMDAGEEVFGPLEWIGSEDRSLVWKENPALPEERRVRWCNLVREFFAGEVENGADDNGNGLIDESGLSFTLRGNAVTIRLCLERPRREGSPLMQYVETVVTVRN